MKLRPAGAMCCLAICAALASAPGRAQAEDGWRGLALIAGGKGYVNTPLGQLHYRDIGPRSTKTPLLLIHQNLMSMVEFGAIQNELALLGLRSIAIDIPGYGLSDPPPAPPTIRDLAETLLPLLDQLNIAKVVVAGHHTGSLLAASLAAHHADRVAAVILHGSPFFNAAESAAALAKPPYDRTPREDGGPITKWFTYRFQGDPVPNTPENISSRTWMLLLSYLMGPNAGSDAVYHHDMEADALAIRAPTLILTDAHDGIHHLDLRLAQLRPDFSYQVFSDFSNLQMMNEPRRWARLAADFAAPYER